MIPTGGEGESTDHTNFCHLNQRLVGWVSQETDSEMLRFVCRSFNLSPLGINACGRVKKTGLGRGRRWAVRQSNKGFGHNQGYGSWEELSELNQVALYTPHQRPVIECRLSPKRVCDLELGGSLWLKAILEQKLNWELTANNTPGN